MKKKSNDLYIEISEARVNERPALKIQSMHPLLIFSYFMVIIIITMITLDPYIIVISFLSSLLFTLKLCGLKELIKSLSYSLIIIIIITLINPLFVHEGSTVLFMIFNNPYSIEALIYGLLTAVMLVSIFCWFRCYSIIMTNEKITFLFGRIAPNISLSLSMIFSFIPRLRKQYNKISASQKTMGMFSKGGFINKLKARFRVLLILLTWSLENSIETADSMNARGYNLKGRTSYRDHSFKVKEAVLLILILCLFGFVLFYIITKSNIEFYPVVNISTLDAIRITSLIAWLILSIFPIIMEVKESLKWRLLISKI